MFPFKSWTGSGKKQKILTTKTVKTVKIFPSLSDKKVGGRVRPFYIHPFENLSLKGCFWAPFTISFFIWGKENATWPYNYQKFKS
jgi:hypothetical protein